MAASQRTTLLSLPNEILLRILSPFPTLSLLPWMPINHRFHALILRLTTARLHLASKMDFLTLILESYHPASKNVEPYLFCDYLGYERIDGDREAKERLGLGSLMGWFGMFRPVRVEEEGRVFQRNGHAPVEGDGEHEDEGSLAESSAPRLVSHNLSLDIDEPFSQLCVATNLVRLGPRRGVFFNFVSVCDSVVRIKRDWLAQRTASKAKEESQNDRTLWIGNKNDVGICFTVQERIWERGRLHAPILMARDEDPAVGYKLEYEVLYIRSLRLLLAFEEASRQAWGQGEARAVVFGNFVRNT